MGSNTKKSKESRKRRHRSRSRSYEEKEVPREKKHRHHRRHKERKREKQKYEYESEDSDVVEVIPVEDPPESPPPPPEISGGGSAESLSIRETNKLRAKLGLKPLQVEGNKSDKQDDGKKKDDLGEFYHKPAHSLTEKNKQEKLRSKLSDHREKRTFDTKLSKVKLLSQEDSDDDAVAWVEKNRRIQDIKKEAERRAMMLEELDAQFGVSEIVESEQKLKRYKQYGEKHLKGLRVDHDVDTFGESAVILTLEDKQILDDGDDVLINVNLRENEKYKKISESKIKKGLGDEELDEFGNLKPKVLLDKYDEEIEGEKRDSFQIGYDNALERKRLMLQQIRNKLSNKIIDNLNTTSLTLASDYYNEEELSKFKKPKKKVRKMRAKGKLTAADLENLDSNKRVKHERDHFDIDDIPAMNPKMEVKMEDEVDDALERALQKSRRLKQKQIINNTLSVADLVKTEPKEESVELGNIVLNSTAEFCRTLGDIPTYGKSGNREDSENLLDIEKEEEEEEEDDDDVEIVEDVDVDEGGKWNAVDPNRIVRESARVTVVETPILDEEPDVGSGVGAALKLAMSKGYLDKEENNRPSNSRFAHLQAQHYSIEDKTYGEEVERGGANRRERYAGPITDFKEKDCFKPNVKLEYIDDEGHILSAKEAFRYLSHKFHGKGPGKNKVEKRLKKSQQEGLMKKMSSTDTPLGTLNMLQSKQKEMQSPYIVLSGGKHTHSTTIAKVRR